AGLFDTQSRAMVVARWNIFDGFRKKYQIEAEESEMLALEERLRDTEDELLLQLTTALENYRTSMERLKVARKAVEQARENYRITENRFRQRMATTTDLLDARFFLTRAENDLKNAEYDYYLSMAEIERVIELDSEALRPEVGASLSLRGLSPLKLP
ncbi:MAG: TolC family protein, partial [Nitrospirae bacterium]|nr:TolC family protein [Nitrospirota bacterium]